MNTMFSPLPPPLSWSRAHLHTQASKQDLAALYPDVLLIIFHTKLPIYIIIRVTDDDDVRIHE